MYIALLFDSQPIRIERANSEPAQNDLNQKPVNRGLPESGLADGVWQEFAFLVLIKRKAGARLPGSGLIVRVRWRFWM